MVLFTQPTTHVLVDVARYFVDAPAAVTSARFEVIGPDRIVETREAAPDTNDFLRLNDGKTDLVRISVVGNVESAPDGRAKLVIVRVGDLGSVRTFPPDCSRA
ncbi:MAG: hypothetical protein ACJAR2_001285 [Ilumatobacter sp.]|jgi:hypothetical protein